MKPIKPMLLAFAVMAITTIAPCAPSSGITLNTLVSFKTAYGSHPQAGLVLGMDGNFYGTTELGGTNSLNFGTVFRMTPAGVLNTLLSFNNTNGSQPFAELVQATSGNLYGTTSQGGTNGGFGTVFQITSNGVFTTLFSFNRTNGSFPEAALAMGTNGNLYGTTSQGGTNGGFGTVFQITTNGQLTTLFSFNNTNGSTPLSGLLPGTNGTFYGTTSAGGANGLGTLFQINTNGQLTNWVAFNGANGANPYAGLIKGTDGNFYGTTYNGGSANLGTIFRMTPAGLLTILISFNNLNGANPFDQLLQGTDGNFYGTTELGGKTGDGTAFQITPQGVFTTLISFDYFSTGNFPVGALVQGTDGNLYGTTHNGGSINGTVFSFPITPTFQHFARTNNSVTFTWSTVPGKSYQVQSTPGLNQTNWNNLGLPILATNTTATASDTVSGGNSNRFYRVMRLP
jgi:uncharacterized repeat protein (TIGR03803 family)